MSKHFAILQDQMSLVHQTIKAIWRDQQEEIGQVNDAHRPMLDAYDQKEERVKKLLADFEAKLNTMSDYGRMAREEKKAERELVRLNDEFEANWGRDLDEHEAKIAKINEKYERLYQETIREAGYDLSAADTDGGEPHA